MDSKRSLSGCIRCGQPVGQPHDIDCPFGPRQQDIAADLIGAGMNALDAMSSVGMLNPIVEVSESAKLARYFLQPIERFSGPDYAAAFCRIVDWFEGRCSCGRTHTDHDEHAPECSKRRGCKP